MKKLLLCCAFLIAATNTKAAQLTDEPAVVNFFPEPRALKIIFHPDQPSEQTEFERKKVVDKAQAEAKRDEERKVAAAQEKVLTPELVAELAKKPFEDLVDFRNSNNLFAAEVREENKQGLKSPDKIEQILNQVAVNHQVRLTLQKRRTMPRRHSAVELEMLKNGKWATPEQRAATQVTLAQLSTKRTKRTAAYRETFNGKPIDDKKRSAKGKGKA